MNISLKRATGVLMACAIAGSMMTAAFAAEATTPIPEVIVTSSDRIGAGTGNYTSEIPQNTTGANSKVMLTTFVNRSDLGKTFNVVVSEFTDGMETVNVAVQIDGEPINAAMYLRENGKLSFKVPSDTPVGAAVDVYMSTNSTPGTCYVEIKPA